MLASGCREALTSGRGSLLALLQTSMPCAVQRAMASFRTRPTKLARVPCLASALVGTSRLDVDLPARRPTVTQRVEESDDEVTDGGA